MKRGTTRLFAQLIPLCMLLYAIVPTYVFGQDAASQNYVPLAGVPGVTDRSDPSLVGYLNAFFTLSIAIAAIVAVIRIVVAGFKYMLATDGWANAEEAKTEIWAVITGLIVLLMSFIILQQINPQLVELRILQP